MGNCWALKKNRAVAGDPRNSPEEAEDYFSIQPSPFPTTLPPEVRPSPVPSTSHSPRGMLNWPLPPPSPAKPIRAMIRRLNEKRSPASGSGSGSGGPLLDKRFGFGRNFDKKYEVVREMGKGHFGNTCMVKVKKGELKGQFVAAKIIPKDKMTTALEIEDVRREVKILKALSGHVNIVKFHDALEDADNVYIVMELCEGGELLDKILSSGGRYNEEDAKKTVVQILNGVAFFHLQGIVHRDLKPENFLLSEKDDDSSIKIIDFGLSDFVRTDQCLNDVVGSAFYVAPEILHRSYRLEADIWSVGVVTYILLCGSRPFWARTESGIFRSVIRNDPNFDDPPWPAISAEAKDFVKRLLNKDPRKRITAAQALTHPWLRDNNRAVPLDMLIYKLVKSYIRATPFKRAALKALLKAIPEDERVYPKAQFSLLQPENGQVSLNNFRMALLREATDAMKESGVLDILNMMAPLTYAMDFEDFCAALINIYQLEAHKDWINIATMAFEFFEQKGNKVISVEELTQEMNLGSMGYLLFKGWIRNSDGKLSLLGYTKLLHGTTVRTHSNTRR